MSSSCNAGTLHEVELLRCGAEFFPALLSAIDQAHSEVLLETYIFASDEAAHRVLDSLVKKGRAFVTTADDGYVHPKGLMDRIYRINKIRTKPELHSLSCF